MKAVHRFLVLALGVILVIGLAPAQITTTGSGIWSSSTPDAPWPGGVVPTFEDNVTIASSHTVTIDIPNAECNDLTISGNLYCTALTTGLGITVYGNATVNSTGKFRPASATPGSGQYFQSYEFKQNLTVVTGGVFDMRQASGAIGVVGRVIFSGSSNSTVSLGQTTYLSSLEEFNYVEINKSGSGKVILASGNLFHSNNATNLPDSLALISGIVETGSNHWVVLRTGGAGVNFASASSYVHGILGRGISNTVGNVVDVEYPVGSATEYRPSTLKVRVPATNTTGAYIWVTSVQGLANTGSSTLNDGVARVSEVRYHQIGYFQGTGSATMEIQRATESYGNDDGVTAGNTNLCVAYSTDARVTWDSVGQTTPHSTSLLSPPTTITPDLFTAPVALTNGAIMYTSVGTFNIGDNTLPAQLTGFSAAADMRGATLSWKTSTELDNAGFEVERRAISEFGIQNSEYRTIGFVSGSGTSTSERSYSFTDDAAPGRYAYRLKQIDRNGASTLSGEVEVEIGLAPRALTLGSYPNPFNPTTVIDFTLPDDGIVTLRVFNLLGQEVATLFNGQATGGRLYQVPFDASRLMSGVYVARLESGQFHAATKLTVMK